MYDENVSLVKVVKKSKTCLICTLSVRFACRLSNSTKKEKEDRLVRCCAFWARVVLIQRTGLLIP